MDHCREGVVMGLFDLWCWVEDGDYCVSWGSVGLGKGWSEMEWGFWRVFCLYYWKSY